jgi:hypothetical protein
MFTEQFKKETKAGRSRPFANRTVFLNVFTLPICSRCATQNNVTCLPAGRVTVRWMARRLELGTRKSAAVQLHQQTKGAQEGGVGPAETMV